MTPHGHTHWSAAPFPTPPPLFTGRGKSNGLVAPQRPPGLGAKGGAGRGGAGRSTVAPNDLGGGRTPQSRFRRERRGSPPPSRRPRPAPRLASESLLPAAPPALEDAGSGRPGCGLCPRSQLDGAAPQFSRPTLAFTARDSRLCFSGKIYNQMHNSPPSFGNRVSPGGRCPRPGVLPSPPEIPSSSLQTIGLPAGHRGDHPR